MASDLLEDIALLLSGSDDDDDEEEQHLDTADFEFGSDGEHGDFPFDLNLLPDDEEFSGTGEQPADPEAGQNEEVHHQPTRNRLSAARRTEILMWLLSKSTDGKLKHGSIQEAAAAFKVSRQSISRMWNTAKKQKLANQPVNVMPRYNNSGRKRITIEESVITSLSMGDRSCLRDIASCIGVSKTTAHRLVERGVLKPHTNSLHPGLIEQNKLTRLSWILGLLIGDTPTSKENYYAMYDFVHMDEKWFYQTKKSHRVYLAKSEKGKYRAAKSSKWIPKAMFTAVVGRPRFNTDNVCIFDGKIGIFPFTYKATAKRTSKNRIRGTLITKCLERVNKKASFQVLERHIIPALMEKWPNEGKHRVIFIQQDNAKAHVKQVDPEWQAIYNTYEGFTFYLIQQPPNSPDLNILDLGFFRSIQSLMHKKMPKNLDAMLDAVHDAFFELDPYTLEDVWMSLQYIMNEVLKSKGGNEYELPHIGKRRLRAQGLLPVQVKSPMHAVIEAWELVNAGPQQPIHANEDEDDMQEDETQIEEV